MKIKDIEAWLRDDSDDVEKTASDNTSEGGYGEDHELMEKLAAQFEDEQFEKLADDAWAMGEIMGHAFLNTLEKVAIADVDGRIAGDIAESVQGEAPMMAQKTEDTKPTQLVPGLNVAAPMVEAMLDQKITRGASTEGGDASASEGQQLMPPPGPSSGNVEQTSASVMQKKVASFLRNRANTQEELSKEAARDVLKQLLRGDI